VISEELSLLSEYKGAVIRERTFRLTLGRNLLMKKTVLYALIIPLS